jgi:catechol 2,3-dioxygenase-like lactoylglutathione lyase family enzyme
MRAKVLGLRLVKKSVNQDDVTASPVVVRDERKTLDFEDPEGQRLSLVLDVKSPQGVPREGTEIPPMCFK